MTLNAAYLVDFDGTITTRDLSSELANYFAGWAYREIEEKYRRREIPIREWLQQMINYLPADLDLLLDQALQWAEIRPGFARFLEQARQNGSPVIIASDGFGFYIEPILRQYNLLHPEVLVYRNHTSANSSGSLRVSNPHAHPQCPVCGNCKAGLVVKLRERGGPVIYIGDGSNDRFGASWSDHVCARDRLADACREYKMPYSTWDDFFDIMKMDSPAVTDRVDKALCSPKGSGIKTDINV